MRILILANNDVGLYKFRKELLERLLVEHEVYISLPNGGFVKNMQEMGCKFIDTNISRHGTNPFQDLKLLSFYKKTIKQLKPDIVFTYTIKPNVYGGMACAKLNVPYVENITGLGTAVENPGLMQKITLFLYKKALRKAQKVFFQNTENKAFFEKHNISKQKYDLLPGSGVNVRELVPTPYPSDDVINFAFVARVMKEKGIDQYLEAAKALTAKYPNVKFNVYGACEQSYEQILKDYQDKGIITYHGLVKDMKPIYQASSCVIHPTYYPEGLSNVLLESSASARPIITTNRSGCREVVDDGINGFVVEEKNAADLIEKVDKFICLSNEEKAQMGLNARKKVEKDFDRNIVIEKYLFEVNSISERKGK